MATSARKKYKDTYYSSSSCSKSIARKRRTACTDKCIQVRKYTRPVSFFFNIIIIIIIIIILLCILLIDRIK